MDAEVWKKIDEIFQAAVLLPAHTRSEFLKQATADSTIRAEVVSMLDAAPDAESFLENSPLSSPLEPGTRLAHFEILERLGRGGMGEVYSARDTRLQRTVAIKILSGDRYGTPQARERFDREAKAISGLNHPNICTLHDVGHEDGIDFLVMEYLEGETLATRLRKGCLPLEQVLQYATQITDALDAAHRHGVVHRDLKPANIMLTKTALKIVDFGLAKMRGAEAAAEMTALPAETTPLTSEGTILGTMQYMAPEQLEGKEADARCDIFALGAVIYEMATGRKAFEAKSQAGLIASILTANAPSISTHQSTAPLALDHVVKTCLEREPDARWQTARDVAIQLRWIGGTSDQTSAATRTISRNWLRWLAGAVATAGVAATIFWIGTRGQGKTVPNFSVRRLTNEPGLTTSAASSPDGKLVAYSRYRTGSDNLDLWVQQIDNSRLVQLTTDPADDYDPTFSPDGAQIAFRSERQGGGIYVVSALGGEARLLIPQGHRPRFSPDGRKLMYWTGPEPSDVRGSSDVELYVQPVAGGRATHIGAGCRLFEQTPVWSPDGSRILFIGTCGNDLVTRSQPDDFGVAAWVFTLDGKGPKPNRELYGLWSTIHGDSPVIDQWIANPSRLLIPLPVGDATSIITVPVSTDGTRMAGPAQRLTFVGGKVARVSAAVNGDMALSANISQSHIWSLPVSSEGVATGVPRQLTTGHPVEFSPSLSVDGQKLAFLSDRPNGFRLFYKDLVTGLEKEISTEGYRYAAPVFNRDATKIMCLQYPSPKSLRDFIFEVPTLGGLSKRIWDPRPWTWLWDWSPDESTLLVAGGGGIQGLDLKSEAGSPFLIDEENLEEAHFSHDGHWVVFTASSPMHFVARPTRSSVYIAPFRHSAAPRSEWIPIADENLNLSPHFSYDDRLVFFVSERDGSACLWAQRLRSDMHLDGPPFAVYHEHKSRHPFGSRGLSNDGFGVGAGAIVFTRTDIAGNIWLLDGANQNGP